MSLDKGAHCAKLPIIQGQILCQFYLRLNKTLLHHLRYARVRASAALHERKGRIGTRPPGRQLGSWLVSHLIG